MLELVRSQTQGGNVPPTATTPTTDISSAAPLLRITAPYKIAAGTYLIPNEIPAGPDVVVGMNSMLIRGTEPVIVDTGALLHSPHGFDMVRSLLDPKNIRWVFLSHDD